MIFRAQRENFWLLGMKISLEGIQEHLRNVNFKIYAKFSGTARSNICVIARSAKSFGILGTNIFPETLRERLKKGKLHEPRPNNQATCTP